MRSDYLVDDNDIFNFREGASSNLNPFAPSFDTRSNTKDVNLFLVQRYHDDYAFDERKTPTNFTELNGSQLFSNGRSISNGTGNGNYFVEEDLVSEFSSTMRREALFIDTSAVVEDIPAYAEPRSSPRNIYYENRQGYLQPGLWRHADEAESLIELQNRMKAAESPIEAFVEEGLPTLPNPYAPFQIAPPKIESADGLVYQARKL